MTHTSQCISLKPSCRLRLKSQVSPSLQQKSFLLENFISPDFPQTLFSDNKGRISKPMNLELDDLNSYILKAEEMFEKVKEKIDALKAEFVHRLTAFYTQEDSQPYQEELELLRHEMKKCHCKIQEGFTTSLADDFSLLLNKYECIKEGSVSTRGQKSEEIVNRMAEVQQILDDNLSEISYSCVEPGFIVRQGVEKFKSSDDKNPDEDDDTKSEEGKATALLTMDENLDDYYCSFTSMNFFRHNYTLLVMKKPGRSTKVKMIDVDQKRVLSRYSNIFDTMRLNTTAGALLYADSIGVLASKCTKGESQISCIRLYRVFPRGLMKRIADITVDSLLPEKGADDELIMEFLQPQHLLAISCGKVLKIVNILTRKPVQTYTYLSTIMKIKYVKDLRYLIIFTNQIEAYEVVEDRLSPHSVFIDRMYVDRIDYITMTANTAIVVGFHECVTKAIGPNNYDDKSWFQFNMFQISRYGFYKLQTSVSAKTLYEGVVNQPLANQTSPRIIIWYFIVNTRACKVSILYSVNEATVLYEKEIRFKCDDLNDCLDIASESSVPRVYNRGHTLFVDTFN